LQVEPVVQTLQRCDLRRAEDGFGVGLLAQPLQIGGRDVVDVERQDLEGEVRIRQPTPARQRRVIDLRVMRRQSRMSQKPRGLLSPRVLK